MSKDIMTHHATQRLRERYGIGMSCRIYDKMEIDLKSGNYDFYCRSVTDKKRFIASFDINRKMVFAVVDIKDNFIITFLTENQAHIKKIYYEKKNGIISV